MTELRKKLITHEIKKYQALQGMFDKKAKLDDGGIGKYVGMALEMMLRWLDWEHLLSQEQI